MQGYHHHGSFGDSGIGTAQIGVMNTNDPSFHHDSSFHHLSCNGTLPQHHMVIQRQTPDDASLNTSFMQQMPVQWQQMPLMAPPPGNFWDSSQSAVSSSSSGPAQQGFLQPALPSIASSSGQAHQGFLQSNACLREEEVPNAQNIQPNGPFRCEANHGRHIWGERAEMWDHAETHADMWGRAENNHRMMQTKIHGSSLSPAFDSDSDDGQVSQYPYYGLPDRPCTKPESGKHQWIDDHGSTEMEGLCHVKMLMPNHTAGALIGAEGKVIGDIMMVSRCQMQISDVDTFFPGTTDRIVIMGGTMESLAECISMSLRRLKEVSCKGDQGTVTLLAKLAVPSSAVSGLIGHQGDKVRKLSDQMHVKINVSARVEGMKERLVLVCGEFTYLVRAVIEIARRIQGDVHLKENLTLKYDINLPLGIWSGEKAQPIDPSLPLIPPEDAECYTKRELIQYLQQAAPREILLKHNLLGNMKNALKSKGTESLREALRDTLDSRMLMAPSGGVTFREKPEVPSTESELPAEAEAVFQVKSAPVALPVGEVKRPLAPSELEVPNPPSTSKTTLQNGSPLPVLLPFPLNRSGADAAAGAAAVRRSPHSKNSHSLGSVSQGPEGAGAGIPIGQTPPETIATTVSEPLIIQASTSITSTTSSSGDAPLDQDQGARRDAMNLSFSFLDPGSSPKLTQPSSLVTFSEDQEDVRSQTWTVSDLHLRTDRLGETVLDNALAEGNVVPHGLAQLLASSVAAEGNVVPNRADRQGEVAGFGQGLAQQFFSSTFSIAGTAATIAGKTAAIAGNAAWSVMDHLSESVPHSDFSQAGPMETPAAERRPNRTCKDTAHANSATSSGMPASRKPQLERPSSPRCAALRLLDDPPPAGPGKKQPYRQNKELERPSSSSCSTAVRVRDDPLPGRSGIPPEPRRQKKQPRGQNKAEDSADKGSRICSNLGSQMVAQRLCASDPFQGWFNSQACGPPPKQRHRSLPSAPPPSGGPS